MPSSQNSLRVVCLPGDCIGPEVMAVAQRMVRELAPDIELEEHLFGAAAIRATGTSLPEETLAACRDADAVLKAPIGDPEFDAAEVRPEQGMLQLRAELDVYANLRPAIRGDVDLLLVRELVGGLYFGARGVREDGTAFDTCEYHPSQVERIARRAFDFARARGGRRLRHCARRRGRGSRRGRRDRMSVRSSAWSDFLWRGGSASRGLAGGGGARIAD